MGEGRRIRLEQEKTERTENRGFGPRLIQDSVGADVRRL
jgi:hypothetical protein